MAFMAYFVKSAQRSKPQLFQYNDNGKTAYTSDSQPEVTHNLFLVAINKKNSCSFQNIIIARSQIF